MSDSSQSWSSIFDPAKDGDFFTADPLPLFRLSEGFSVATAWWMAEFARLSYAPFELRHGVLEALGMEERFFCRVQNAQVAMLVPKGNFQSDARFGVLAFKGTSELREWLTNLDSVPRSWDTGGHVHGGFARAMEELWKELAPRVAAFSDPLLLTGHSLGAALATLTASRCRPEKTELYTFGSPRVGNAEFVRSLDGLPAYRVVNGVDLVTQLPASLGAVERFNFTHVGEERMLSDKGGDSGKGRVGLTEIAASLRQAKPPQPFVDHAPCNYCEGLRRELAG